MNNQNGRIMVSVATITYNHEAYIEKAIRSVVQQSTTFDFEMIIGEDCSNDQTRSIIRKYQMLYPSIVKPVYHKKNVGGTDNFISALNNCSGKYVAILDGDDIMLPGKLQKQYDFMEKNLDYAMCGHNVRIFESDSGKTIRLHNTGDTIKKGTIDTFAELGTYLASASVMYRREFVDIGLFEELHHYAVQGDWLLHLIVAKNGYVGYIDEVLSEYRRHESGVTQTSKASLDNKRQLLEERLGILDDAMSLGASRRSVDIGKTWLLAREATEMLYDRRYTEFRDYINQASRKKQYLRKKYLVLYYLQNFPGLLYSLMKTVKYLKRH